MKTPIEVAEYCCKFEGDLVEIGAGTGETTIQLLELAEKYDKKVVVVDPFEYDWHNIPEDYAKGYAYNDFMNYIEKYKDRLILYRYNSLSHEAAEALRGHHICFAYIDGLQYRGAVLNDLRITSHAICQCLDDYDRISKKSQVPYGLAEYKTHKELNIIGRWAYLL